ncbi:hypothetical protein HDU87_000167 [Geranomyces variabilis]|uniref:Thiaminase-2/PQQC domain-containing protein n=1 Tax=Geranomyces variabilis TaxID=109894 RepID=A0AAD5TS46_9FUNG|nr:hypothetical protein HDU87_000167 [Geranomyces variabilis]
MAVETPTARLVDAHALSYTAATRHEFLSRVAAAGEAGDVAFDRWLAEDFHFVVAYLKFISILLARAPTENLGDRTEPIVAGFLTAIENISKEAQFFRSAAAEMRIPLSYSSSSLTPSTARYLAFLDRVATESTWPEALLVLWAVERIYLDSWTFAAESMPLKKGKYERFVRHWANAEFAEFVQWLEDLADAELRGKLTPKMDELFKTVVELEIAFWDSAVAEGAKEMYADEQARTR